MINYERNLANEINDFEFHLLMKWQMTTRIESFRIHQKEQIVLKCVTTFGRKAFLWSHNALGHGFEVAEVLQIVIAGTFW